ncbi:MAG TPA: hypothetical protein PLU24_01930 [Candidatus Omnitrophota bacterium]|nr:hypothetical protein [Candidatus Omnitrophota bacterium]
MNAKVNLRYLILLCLILATAAFCPRAFAAASLTVSGGNWEIGQIQSMVETSTSSTQWTITNDSHGTEDILIKVQTTGSGNTYTARTVDDNNNNASEYIVRINNSSGMLVTGTDKTLAAGLADGATYDFGLWFKAPNYGSIEENETLTITLTATNWVSSCVPTGGFYYANSVCWRLSTAGQTCATACASYGGCTGVAMTYTDSYNVGRAKYPSCSISTSYESNMIQFPNTSLCYMPSSNYTYSCSSTGYSSGWPSACPCAN